ncbi:MAG: FAD-dependent oxidoreductase [Ginsengibacter sp.]
MNILILGAGFGGLEVATSLRAKLDENFKVTLIDKKDFFIVGFSKFDLMFGRKTPEDVKSYYSELRKQGIDFVQDTIERIDPHKKVVKTTGATFTYDYLVIGLGVDLHPEAIPGFKEGGYSFYSFEEAQRLRPAVEEFKAGTILISIFNKPYQCPPAPYEGALQLHDYFEKKGTRANITIKVLAPGPIPLPVSKETSASIMKLLSKHDIEFLPKHKVTALDTIKKQAIIDGLAPMDYDLFMGVPIHRPPKVILESVFGKDGWIKVDRTNLKTEFDNVYAIGDVTHIPVGDFAVPKTGSFAEDAAKAVVADMMNRIKGEHNEVKYHAAGTCYFELESGKVAKIDANFLGGDEPQLSFIGPSEEYLADKIEFETSRIKKWFHPTTDNKK